jgi:hypothetical protein
LGNFLLGFLIDRPALFGNGRLHNCSTIFLLSATSAAFAFFWILFMLGERKDKQRFDEYVNMIQLQQNPEVNLKSSQVFSSSIHLKK